MPSPLTQSQPMPAGGKWYCVCNVHSKAACVCADHVCICPSTDDSSAHETEQWMSAKSMCVRADTLTWSRVC